MTRPRLEDLPPRAQAEARAQLAKVSHPRTIAIEVAPALPTAAPVKKRIRQNSAGLNKTEQAFFDHLSQQQANPVLSQAITLRLANGVRYTPDFMIAGGPGAYVSAYEVKGFMRDDAAIKLKVAAALYTWIDFYLVTKRKGGGWDVQEILP